MISPTESPSPPASGRPSGQDLFRTLARTVLFAAAVVTALWFAYAIRQLILLLILVFIVALVLNAPVTWLDRRGVSRGVASALTMLTLMALAVAGAAVVLPRLLLEVPTFLEEVPRTLDRLTIQASEWFGGAPEVERQLIELSAWVDRALGRTWRIAGDVAAALVLLLFTIAMVLYVLADPRPVLRWLMQVTPEGSREAVVRAFHRASRMVVGWVLANAILGVVKAFAIFVFLTFLEIPGALLWSLPALFAALIPRLGFYLMSIPPFLAALSVDWTAALWTGLFLVVMSEILGNFVAPRVQGEIMELHAAFLLAMTLAMGLAFGVLGVVIASPVAGFVKVFYDEFYLARQREDSRLAEHVETMLDGSLQGLRTVKEVVPR